MAFKLGDGDDDAVMADINVTPLVDVMLVLLIIFMIAVPMLHQGIEVALPRAEAQNLPIRVEDPLIVSVDRGGQVFLGDQRVDKEDLVDVVKQQIAARGRDDDTVYLKGDRDIPYGDVVEILDLLHRGGISRIGMVTEKPKKGGSGGR